MYRLLLPIFLLSFFHHFSFAQSDPCKKKKLINKSLKFSKTKPQKALKLLEKAIRKDPNCPLPYLRIAEMNEASKPEEAVRYYNLAILHGADSTIAVNRRDQIFYSHAMSEYEKKHLINANKLFKQLENNISLKRKAKKVRYEILLELSDQAVQARNSDKALEYLNSILLEEINNKPALGRKITLLEENAMLQYQKGNKLESLDILRQVVDYYQYLERPVSCKNYSLRATIHLELLRKTEIVTDLKGQLMVLDDLLAYPKVCSEIQSIQNLVVQKKQEIWNSLAETLYKQGDFEEAYSYILKLMPLRGTKLIRLHENILYELALNAYKVEQFDRSLFLLENLRKTSKDKKASDLLQLYSNVKLSYAKDLYRNKQTEPALRQAIILCDELMSDSKLVASHSKAKKLRKGIYLSLIKTLRGKSDTYELLDYINRLKIEYPNDREVENLRASLILDFGIHTHRNRYYEMAAFYYSEAQKTDTKYSAISTYYTAKLYEANFSLDTASVLMQKAISNLAYVKNPLVKQAKRDFSKYQSILRNENSVIDYLYEFYCSSDYQTMRGEIKKDNSYYNMQENPRFMRWVNGVRRLKISGLCATIDYNPDADETGDWLGWKGPDLLAQLFGSSTGHVIGDYRPCWNNWSAVRDFTLGYDNSEEIVLYDYDPHILSKDGFEYVATLSTKDFCSVGSHSVYERTSQGNVSVSYYVEDSSESPYTTSYVYGGKSGLQVGFELSLCVAKKFLTPGTFFYVTLAEGILIDNSIENNEAAIENAMVKTITKIAKGVLPAEIRQMLKAYGIVKCFYQAIHELEKSGWVKENYTEEGNRIVASY